MIANVPADFPECEQDGFYPLPYRHGKPLLKLVSRLKMAICLIDT